jgi:hypothetical protein
MLLFRLGFQTGALFLSSANGAELKSKAVTFLSK